MWAEKRRRGNNFSVLRVPLHCPRSSTTFSFLIGRLADLLAGLVLARQSLFDIGGRSGNKQRLTACAIEETVTKLNGLVDGVGSNSVVDLPEAEAHLGHIKAAVELDVGHLDHFDGLCVLRFR